MIEVIVLTQKLFKATTVLLALFIFVLYVFFVIKNTYNIPLWDDYDTVLGFLSNWQNQGSIHDKLRLLVAQHNVHRMVFSNLVTIIYYLLTGTVNFFYLTIIGNIFLILIIIFILQVVIVNLHDGYFSGVLITVALLLSPIQFGAELWSGAGIEFYSSVWFTLLVIKYLINYLEHGDNFNLGAFVFFVSLDMFVCGAFLPLFAATILLVLYTRRYKLVGFLALLYGFLCYIYFIALPYTFLPRYDGTLIQEILFFFNFLACGLNINNQFYSVLIGSVVLLLVIILRKEILQNKLILCWFIFIFIMDVMAAYQRGGYANNGNSSRYAIYSLISYVFLGYLLIKNKLYNYHFIFAILSASVFCAYFIVVPRTSFFIKRYEQIKLGIFYPTTEKAINLYWQAKAQNIYSSKIIEQNIKNLK